MSAFSDYFENRIINHMLRNQAFTPPPIVYLALFTSATGLEANSGVTGEVTGGAYARQAITLSAAAAGASSNSADLTFPVATSNWGTISHVAIVDHATDITWGTNVNVLMFAALSSSKTINQGDSFKVLSGDLSVTVA